MTTYGELLKEHEVLDKMKQMVSNRALEYFHWINQLVTEFNKINEVLAPHDLVLPMAWESILMRMTTSKQYYPEWYRKFNGYLHACIEDIGLNQELYEVNFEPLVTLWSDCDMQSKKLQELNTWEEKIKKCEQTMQALISNASRP